MEFHAIQLDNGISNLLCEEGGCLTKSLFFQ